MKRPTRFTEPDLTPPKTSTTLSFALTAVIADGAHVLATEEVMFVDLFVFFVAGPRSSPFLLQLVFLSRRFVKHCVLGVGLGGLLVERSGFPIVCHDGAWCVRKDPRQSAGWTIY